MTGDSLSVPTFVSAVALGALIFAGCAGTQIVGVAGTPAPAATFDDNVVPTGPPPGTWTGTITLHGVVNEDVTKDVTSGDPGSTYYSTGTTHDVTKLDVTDTYTVTATDPDDLTYGIHTVRFDGAASNRGSTLERYVQNWNKQNSGCTWKEETGIETSGTWTDSGKTEGSLDLSDDGTYTITVRADPSGPDGSYETPELPEKLWQHISDISAGCTGDTYDTQDTNGPVVWWVSSFLGETDVSGKYATISGQLPLNPGTTVDGYAAWRLENPALQMDATWHLVPSSAIVLPHS